MFILIHLTGFAWDDEHSYNITIDHTQSISIYQSIFKLPVKDDPQNGDKRQGNREAVDSKNNGGKSKSSNLTQKYICSLFKTV